MRVNNLVCIATRRNIAYFMYRMKGSARWSYHIGGVSGFLMQCKPKTFVALCDSCLSDLVHND